MRNIHISGKKVVLGFFYDVALAEGKDQDEKVIAISSQSAEHSSASDLPAARGVKWC
jgi:hypothetical protein